MRFRNLTILTLASLQMEVECGTAIQCSRGISSVISWIASAEMRQITPLGTEFTASIRSSHRKFSGDKFRDSSFLRVLLAALH